MIEWLIPLASTALGGYMGYKQQQAQEKARKEQALINMYSPIFGGSPQALPMAQNYQNPGAIQGFLTGYGIMNQMNDNAKHEAALAAAAAAADHSQTTKTDVFVPYSVQEPLMSQGLPDTGPYAYRANNPFIARNPYVGN